MKIIISINEPTDNNDPDVLNRILFDAAQIVYTKPSSHKLWFLRNKEDEAFASVMVIDQ